MPIIPDGSTPNPTGSVATAYAIPRRLAPWVNESDLTDDPDLLNIKLPTGVTMSDLCEAATDYLWRASGSRYDAHEITVRPSHLVSGCDNQWGVS